MHAAEIGKKSKGRPSNMRRKLLSFPGVLYNISYYQLNKKNLKIFIGFQR